MMPNPAFSARRPPPLRPYQLEPLRAIMESVRTGAGRTYVVSIARQGGKNELSARLEALLLTGHAPSGGHLVKTAPTLEPQLRTSYNRLSDYLKADRIPHRSAWPQLFVGRADITMLSGEAAANVVGATASLLLEVDEAQDVDEEIFNVRFRPMASTSNATTVLYGTAWEEDDLLQRTINANAALQAADGCRRNFIYNWQEVTKYNENYGRFVSAERGRLGSDHPHFQTQYELIPLVGEGRLFTPAQLAQLQGDHARERGAILGSDYIAAVDIAGQDTGSGRLNDRTVLTIGRTVKPDAAQQIASVQPVQIVDQIAWRGASHADLLPALVDLLRQRRVRAVVVDATGIGQTSAALIKRSLPRCTVIPFTFTRNSKSAIGFDLIAAVNTGAMKIYAPDGSPEHTATIDEAARARRETHPNKTINFYVPESAGNDDYLITLAMLATLAKDHPVRRAVGR